MTTIFEGKLNKLPFQFQAIGRRRVSFTKMDKITISCEENSKWFRRINLFLKTSGKVCLSFDMFFLMTLRKVRTYFVYQIEIQD